VLVKAFFKYGKLLQEDSHVVPGVNGGKKAPIYDRMYDK